MIGILTFHRAYNYGAVIQAYALLQECKKIGLEKVEIIDYIIPTLTDYTDIISVKNGPKRFMKSFLLLPRISKRISRKKKFNNFINNRMTLSPWKVDKADDMKKIIERYNSIIVGSDQIWNVKKEAEFEKIYFLPFGGSTVKKIAYAPSIGISLRQDLLPYADWISEFDYISCREKGGSKELSDVTGREVQTVLDPTLLIDKEIILSLTHQTKEKPYLLYYSLDGFDKRNRNMDLIKEIGEKYNLDIKLITPEWPYHNSIGEDIIDAGPEDFLTLINNASLVCTNSFHGTALSIKLERPFFVLEKKDSQDERKRSILSLLRIEERIISNSKDIADFPSYIMDYEEVKKRLSKLQESSLEFLAASLTNDVSGE